VTFPQRRSGYILGSGYSVNFRHKSIKRWFFHLPALGPNGTVIRFVSGIILAWDGREVLHCTGMSPDGAGADNMLHGYFVAAR
jgi:hypothetical protein